MKTKITKKTETTIHISKKDVLEMLRKTYPNIPDDCYISHIESDEGDEIIGLEVVYNGTE